MRPLLWKDWRLLRLPIAMGCIVLVLPYFVVLASLASSDDLVKSVSLASGWSLTLCCAVFPFWAGYVVAAEQRSMSLRFLAQLPANRSAIVASKLTVSAVPAILILAVNTAILTYTQMTIFEPPYFEDPNMTFFDMNMEAMIWQPYLIFATPAALIPPLAFMTAWLFSVYLNKGLLSIIFGILFNFLILAVYAIFQSLMRDHMPPMKAALAFGVVSYVVAMIGIVIGYRRMVRAEMY